MIGRLQGGPADGDTAELRGPTAPDALWVVRCADPQGCDDGGYHWWLDAAAGEQDAKRQHERRGWGDGQVHRYRHARMQGGGVHVYVYADLTPDGYRALHEQRPEPVPA